MLPPAPSDYQWQPVTFPVLAQECISEEDWQRAMRPQPGALWAIDAPTTITDCRENTDGQ